MLEATPHAAKLPLEVQTACSRCCGDNTKPNANSSYKERLCAPIAERLGEFGFAAHIPASDNDPAVEISLRPVGGKAEFSIDGVIYRLSAPEARTLANGLNSVADIVDQLRGTWTGRKHPALERERIG